MPVKITLLDTATNATAEFVDNCADEDKYEDSFIWTDGNYACDCNRFIFFYGRDKADLESIQCGDNRFEVIKWEKQ